MVQKIAITLLTLLLLIGCDHGGDGGSTPTNPRELPRVSIEDFTYQGGFRLKAGKFGNSDINYAVGTLAYNPDNHSLFVVGHSYQSSIAEFPLVTPEKRDTVEELPVTAKPIQGFSDVINQVENPDQIDRITGMLYINGSLIVNAETWYDAPGDNVYTTLVVPDATKVGENTQGYYKMSGAAHSGGYMGVIPEVWQELLQGKYYTGWSSVYSIVSRYSVGPSLWVFDPVALVGGAIEKRGSIPATALLNFPYKSGGQYLVEDALNYAAQGEEGPFTPASPIWNILSRGVYGFIVPGTRTFMVVGSSGGLEGGIGYKAVQENGNVCGGPCTYKVDDNYNYYWLFDLNEVLDAENPYDPKPYSYGKWSIPFDQNGTHKIIGATFNSRDGVLYLALSNAGQVGAYDRPPLIVTFQLTTK